MDQIQKNKTSRESGKRAQLRRKVWFEEYKSNLSCCKCGVNHPAVLDFHHLDPTNKSFGISEAVRSGVSHVKLLTEIAKCEVICANCHRIQHWNEIKSSRTIDLLVIAKRQVGKTTASEAINSDGCGDKIKLKGKKKKAWPKKGDYKEATDWQQIAL